MTSPGTTAPARLEVRGLSVNFGAVRAVDGVDLTVPAGELVGLIGPNGAGKTTLVDAVGGFVPSTGQVLVNGRDLSRLAPHRRARAGLARTWQSLELFDDLTVAENLEAAVGHEESARPLAGRLWARPRARRPDVTATLALLDLDGLADRLPRELSQGQRKLVGVGRALAPRPLVVCLDEPAAGLDTTESQVLGTRLRTLTADGTAVLLIDHDMGLVLEVCDRVYVLDAGRIIATGTPAEIRRDERVIGAYLGEAAR